MIKFTIITICLNNENEIENTIASVYNQTCTDFEYLIKDGISQDRTVNIAESFAPAFAEKSIPFRIISQADSGIYDAMNQAVREAQGEWVIFMNAGDRFADESVLEQVAKSNCLEGADVVYGDTILREQELFCYQKASPLEVIRMELPFCHQSAFTRKALFDNNAYSLQYRICSDHRFYLQLYREGGKFVYFPEAISIYDVNGISSNWMLSYQETIKILEELPVRDEEAIRRRKEKKMTADRRTFMHQHLWKYVPKKLREKRRELMRKKAGWKTEEEMFGQKKDNP